MAAERSFLRLTAETDGRLLSLLPAKEYKVIMAMVPEITCEEVDFYRDNDESQFYEADGPNQKKGYFQYPDLCSKESPLEEDVIQLKFTSLPHQFHQTVMVVVAIEKMRHLNGFCSQLFQDNDLNIFTSIFQEEPVTVKSCDIYESDSTFQFISSQDCTIQDINQKCLALSKTSELQALHLNGRNISQQVIFSMKYLLGEIGSQKTYVVLCIKKNNLYLSCVRRGEKPILQLEQITNFPSTNVEKRFIFNKIEINNTTEFESAEYPNWYISTSQLDDQPVFLGNIRGGKDITDFILDDLS
ncbi:interleukin-1 beta [Vombatus ursinus]|uniref:Multifunctional fusion protein n=1 Tax=Vombatus ursinus TaxID=29139 RepID=A0A4X2KHF0_VOMUR|nr:interleukin-1 beta [Vombatus ursinus]